MGENKVVFCHELGRLIGRYTRNIEVEDIRYETDEDTGNEFAVLRFVNGYSKRVCITGDSCLAIMHDVYKALIRGESMSTPVICPECGGKTQTYVYKETVMRHFPLFCRHCKKTFDVCKDAYKDIRVTRE